MIDWIKTQDGLPDASQINVFNPITVLTYNGDEVMPLAYAKDLIRGKIVLRWKYLFNDSLYDGKEITHWAYLPEPPCDEKIDE